MSVLQEKSSRSFPRYALVPVAVALIINLLAFYGTRPLIADWQHHDISFWLDEKIPFLPVFISVYVLAYVQWLVGLILIAREGREFCYRYCMSYAVALTIAAIIFMAFPTSIDRPQVAGDGLWAWLTGLIFSADTPNNLFPSIHCLFSWLVFRSALSIKRVGKWYSAVSLIFTLLVFASVVFVKQHFVLDILGGVIVAELGLLIANKTGMWRWWEKIQPRWAK